VSFDEEHVFMREVIESKNTNLDLTKGRWYVDQRLVEKVLFSF